MKPSELLSSPEKWCKGTTAKTSNGCHCSAFDSYATSWCIAGAIAKCYFNETSSEGYQKYFVKISEVLKKRKVKKTEALNFNDDVSTTYEDVISVLQEAGL